MMVEKMPVRRPKNGLPTAYLMYCLMRTSISFRTAEERLIIPIKNKTIPLIMINISLIAKICLSLPGEWLQVPARL